ncbi:hypothetical protein O181_014424 [Austropuccinia psidii MF-1]|uniref:Uncharacterized protein n=1 Tax=Austropuccinia psidii MF-1 TaxID=1389203 RepID=A0A9Q3C027_9BASI|nr:hypothetical protein [Austropuccinia psidii MF-1]
MESYSHLPQLSNSKIDLSKIQASKLRKTKPNRRKGSTARNSGVTEVAIDRKHTNLLLDPEAFCSCALKYFYKNCVPNLEDQLSPIYGIQFNSASNPMKELGIIESTGVFPHINGNLRITIEFVVMENCSSTPFSISYFKIII